VAYLHAKFYLDASKHLATVHQRHRQDRQRSDSIGRTVLQTAIQKFMHRDGEFTHSKFGIQIDCGEYWSVGYRIPQAWRVWESWHVAIVWRTCHEMLGFVVNLLVYELNLNIW